MRQTGMSDSPTPVQLQILDYLETGPKRRVICAFRGVGKSSLSAMYLLYRLYMNPEEKCLVVSASMSRAEALTAWMLKTIADLPFLQHMQPNAFDGRYSRIAFDVGSCKYIEQSASVTARGVTGQITGARASIILADDVETVQTCLTETQRQKLRTTLNEAEVVLKPGENSEVIYLGTPHSATDSIYFALERDLNYDIRFWPSRIPDDITPYKGHLAPLIAAQRPDRIGRPSDIRFSEDELMQRELSMSTVQNQLQMMLNPSLLDLQRYPLRCADLMVIDIDRHVPEVMLYEKHKHYIVDVPCMGMQHDPHFYRPRDQQGSLPVDEAPTVCSIDPSAGGGDAFAVCVVSAWGGNYFIRESYGVTGGVNEALWKRVAMTCKEYGVNEILVETNFGGLSIYQSVLAPYLRAVGAECRLEPVRANIQKERRIIDTMAPLVQTHRVAIDRRVVERDYELAKNAKDERELSYSLIHQYSRITYDRGSLLHDDQLDALAYACQWFQDQAALDQKSRARDRSMELLLASTEDESGYALMNVQRQAMGMTLEQCRQADSSSYGSWI